MLSPRNGGLLLLLCISQQLVHALDLMNITDMADYCKNKHRILPLQDYQIHKASVAILPVRERALIDRGQRKKMINEFYTFSFDGITLAEFPRKEIYYMRIFKNGNDEIRALLEHATGNRTEVVTYDTFLPRYQKTHRGRKGKSAFIFTFTRDPMSRFISAYTEVMVRRKDWFRVNNKEYEPLPVKNFIDELLHYRHHFFKDMDHVWSQLGPMTLVHEMSKYMSFEVHLYRGLLAVIGHLIRGSKHSHSPSRYIQK